MGHLLFATPIGSCGLAWNDAGLTAFVLPGRDQADTERWLARQTGTRDPATSAAAAPPWIGALIVQVQRHLAGDLQDFTDVPLDFSRVSPFARRVYEAARTVPAGQTRTYGDLAGMLREPSANSRTIGALMGSNPWPLIVPCHRIIGAGGRLIGFSSAGGVRLKARLLAIEGAQLLAE